uniref:islet amyloid polypeptide n=1 Tax=Jaculus jaculus TaxID=51337 RepID=UPI000332EBD8|nr:islet amyloid polypeptide [Jaculus jaculus]
MCIPKLPAVLLVLSVAFSYLKATPVESHHMDKRKCNTATCATQRLANFLVRSSSSLGVILPATNVGSNTYGKRTAVEGLTREPLNYFPL